LLSFGYDSEDKIGTTVKILDLETKSFHSLDFYSKEDSIVRIQEIVGDTESDTLFLLKYTAKANSQYAISLIETDYQFEFVNEYAIEWPDSITQGLVLIDSYIEGNFLNFSGYSVSPPLIYDLSLDLTSNQIVRASVEESAEYWRAKEILEDGAIVKAGSSRVFLYDSTGNRTAEIPFSDRGHNVGFKSASRGNELFFAGHARGTPAPTDVFWIYKYRSENQSFQALLSDTLETDDNKRCFYNIDVSSDGQYIYAGLTLAGFGCASPLNSSCDSEFRIYAVDTAGTSLWVHDVGGDAMHSLMQVVATPDNGVLALYYRYNEFEPETQGDIYWIKFNEDGTQDLDYLDGFVPASTKVEERFTIPIRVYPNPASDQVLFNFAPLTEASILRLYDVHGRLVLDQKVSIGQSEIYLDVSGKPAGCYFWSLRNLNDFFRLADGRLLLE